MEIVEVFQYSVITVGAGSFIAFVIGVIFLIKHLRAEKLSGMKKSEELEAKTTDSENESVSDEDEEESSEESELDEFEDLEPTTSTQSIDGELKIGKLHGKLATAQLKAETRKMEEAMSQEEIEYENRMKNAQMESIMKLMMENQEKFGMSSEDIQEQMNLYKF